MEWDGFIDSVPKLHEEAPIPNALVRGVSHGHVFHMGGILSYSLLLS